ncbi:hypothetical protein [Clostridium estertheticum]|uniref:hypothetical protein n=1 Tax=Clostridium estertheticum TaxID=238834 RepID=UPI001CF3A02A|nr:hypothetical protein [Clostridium estertheticum]MCB2357045.1 hypothetical protein [Clostridium estertheticum]WAG40372.1 hypothetical protein LL065_19200 [Clostridium estertheticum]
MVFVKICIKERRMKCILLIKIMSKKKRKSIVNGKLIAIRQELLAGKKDSRQIICKLKNNFNIIEIEKVIDELFNFKQFYKDIYGIALPKTYDELMKYPPFKSSGSLEKEINWYTVTLCKFSKEINCFIDMKNKFEIKLINGEYNEAEEIINYIEKDICVSVWSIENRLLLEEFKDGLEKNKELLSIINEYENNGIIPLVADFLSKRAERGMSFENYNQNLNRLINKVDGIDLKEYLFFKLNHWENNIYSEPAFILHVDNNLSIIDRYITYIKMIEMIVVDFESGKAFIGNIMKLSKKINDKGLIKIIQYYQPETEIILDEISILINMVNDLYLVGKYEECLNLCKENISTYSNCFQLYNYYVKSLMYLNLEFKSGNNSLMNELLVNIYSIYIDKIKTDAAYDNIKRIIQQLSSAKINYQLHEFLFERLMGLESRSNTILSELNTEITLPNFSRVYKDKNNAIQYLNKYYETNKDVYSTSFLLTYYQNINGHNEVYDNEIPSLRRERYIAKQYIIKEAYNDAIIIYENNLIPKYNNSIDLCKKYVFEEIMKNLYISYLNISDISKCLDILIENYFEYNKYFTLRFDIKTLIQKIENQTISEKKILFKNISIAILYHINSKMFGDDLQNSSKIVGAIDNYLRLNKINTPSNIQNNFENINLKRLIFFLSRVCNTEILRRSYKINSPEKLMNERTAICNWLINLDPENSNEYLQEKKDILKGIMIEKRMKVFDESKIYVDTEAITNIAISLIKESFERYVKATSFTKGFKFVDLDIDSENISSLIYLNDDKPNKINEHEVTYVNDFKYTIFKELVIQLRDQFLFNKQFGLDSFLSARIRHGIITTKLRKKFEDLYLVTLKDKTGIYDKNDYWNSKISIEGEDKRAGFNNILDEFSNKIDVIIYEKLKEWMQIKIDSKSNGLFEYKFDETILKQYYEKYKDIDSCEIFIDSIFESLWIRSEENLDNIKNKLSSELKHDFLYELNCLNNQIKTLFPNNDNFMRLFSSITVCKVKIESEVDSLIKWFNINKNEYFINYSMDELLSTCLAIIDNEEFSCKIRSGLTIISDKTFVGNRFTYFVDILLILLNNSIRRSQVKVADLDIKMEIIQKEEILKIRISNNVSEKDGFDKIIDAINEIKFNLTNSNDMGKIRKEGGTGFYKIDKILKYNLKRNNYKFNFYLENNIFIVNIEMETGGLVEYEDTSC